MARPKQYQDIFKSRATRAAREVCVIVIYDIQDDRLRNRISELCLDYGLERIQYSAFFGKLTRNLRQELSLRIQREIGDGVARVHVVPVCEEDVKQMWVLEQYWTQDEEQQEEPKLRILGEEEF